MPYSTQQPFKINTNNTKEISQLIAGLDAGLVDHETRLSAVSGASVQTFSDANVTVLAATTLAAQTGTLSASRTVTLPAASSVAAGKELIIADISGTVTATNTLVIARAGSDTINGTTSAVMAAPYGFRRLVSDGTSKWTFDGGIARLGTVGAYTAQQYFSTATLTDAATINWNLSTAQVAKLTIGGNRTLANPTNMVDGGTYILRITQDGTGSRTLAYGTAYKWPGGTAPVLSTTAGAVDIITFVSDGTNMYGNIQKAFA